MGRTSDTEKEGKMKKSIHIAIVLATVLSICLAASCSGKVVNDVSISGILYDGSGRAFSHDMSMIPVDKEAHSVDFTLMGQNTTYSTEFSAEYVTTTTEPDGELSDIVRIHCSLLSTPFAGHQARLQFDGHKADGTQMPIDQVVQPTPGWTVETATFPALWVTYVTTSATGETDFYLNYSYLGTMETPEPGSFVALSGLLLSAAIMCKRRRK